MIRAWLQDFKAFLLQGSIVELAVAFVIGVAFAAPAGAFARPGDRPT